MPTHCVHLNVQSAKKRLSKSEPFTLVVICSQKTSAHSFLTPSPSCWISTPTPDLPQSVAGKAVERRCNIGVVAEGLYNIVVVAVSAALPSSSNQ